MIPEEGRAEIEKTLKFDAILKSKKIKSALDMMSPDVVKHHVQMGMVVSTGGNLLFQKARSLAMKERLMNL